MVRAGQRLAGESLLSRQVWSKDRNAARRERALRPGRERALPEVVESLLSRWNPHEFRRGYAEWAPHPLLRLLHVWRLPPHVFLSHPPPPPGSTTAYPRLAGIARRRGVTIHSHAGRAAPTVRRRLRVAIERDEYAACRPRSAVSLSSRAGGGLCRAAAPRAAAGASRSCKSCT